MLGKTDSELKDTNQVIARDLNLLHQADGLELVVSRNYFYQRVYNQMFYIMIVLVVAIIVAGSTIAYLIANPTLPQYFATTSTGKLIKLQPLNQPNLSKAALVQWVTEAIVESNSYDFANYRKQLQRSSKYFTAKGFDSFTEALRKSGTLELVKERKLLVRATITESPIITGETVLSSSGFYAWKVEVPITLSAENNVERRSDPYLATVVVVRASTLEYSEGVAIRQIILSKKSRKS